MANKCVYVFGYDDEKRCYIGETEDLKRRFDQHTKALEKREHFNHAMQMDFDKKEYDNVKALAFFDCNEYDKEMRKIFEKVMMLIFLDKKWQIYNTQTKEKNLESSIIYDIKKYVEDRTGFADEAL